MDLQYRIELLSRLGQYMRSDEDAWIAAKEKASYENGWFIPAFIQAAAESIEMAFLQKEKLENWTKSYQIPQTNTLSKKIGIVMAGNIPLVGFHDFLCVFITGHKAVIKPSSKDQVLIRHLVEKLAEWAPESNRFIEFSEMLKNCDAYIATGSNNTSRYFDYYFAKYPHIIRRNRTSVAILNGHESTEELEKLADDVYLYFGLGCRNVTKILVPAGYDFLPILSAFKKYNYLADHHKYKNNYDYNLAILLLNKKYYMSDGTILLVEDSSLFSPISQLNYEYYNDEKEAIANLESNPDLQCITGSQFIPFGQAQHPSLSSFPDGVDTLAFLLSLQSPENQ
jgi:hypothetical protein